MIWPFFGKERRDRIGRVIWRQGVACSIVLLSLAACSPPAATKPAKPLVPPTPAVLELGQSVYEQLCATCHGNGYGGPTAPSLADSDIVKNSPGEMINIILRGRRGPAKINGQLVDAIMPPQSTLPDEDIAAAITYVRHAFGKVDDLTTPAEVAAKR